MLLVPGSLTMHMAVHIFVMTIAAPTFALAALKMVGGSSGYGSALVLPTGLQIALLWAWHAPPVLQVNSQSWHTFMTASLLVAATWYWFEVFRIEKPRSWRAMISLLITSKLFCLLGVLYVFAPRALYPEMLFHQGSHLVTSLADQQLAGLLMLTACPTTYLLAAIWIATRWLGHLELDIQPASPPPDPRAAYNAS